MSEYLRRDFLRAVWRSGLAVGTAGSGLALLAGCARPARTPVSAPSELRPVRDPTTGLELLRLPEGFRYFSFGWTGDVLGDGSRTPPNHDGMGIVGQRDGRLVLIRNHELWEDTGAFALPGRAYDPGAGGGTVTLELDLAAERLVAARASLAGTCANCSGGVTPWGSWVSSEEQVRAEGEVLKARDGRAMTRFERPHGFNFEVPIDGEASHEPLYAMGQFRHEAVAVDRRSGIVYQTEDRAEAGFYRFLPAVPGRLAAGGRLQMLRVEGSGEMRQGLRVGQRWTTSWVEITDPTRAHALGSTDQGGCFAQGRSQGGAVFTRLEGIYAGAGRIYFISTSGGDAKAGQVFAYDPERERLELVYESPGAAEMYYPDQMTGAPDGSLVLCQDSYRGDHPQALYWLGRDGRVRVVALNHAEVEGKHGVAEWSGACFSPDGKWLLANIYTPGFSVAITGPWDRL